MPIIIKNPNSSSLEEYMMLEIQGDLNNRYEDVKDCSGSFVGDVLFNKSGHPILIIGHHILFGFEKKLAKPFVVIEKVAKPNLNDTVPDSQTPVNISILDNTINIENRTEANVEYHARAIIRKKLVFNQRPRPIISTAL